MNNGKILLVTDSYPPEVRSSSGLMQDLAIGLVKRGFDVTVVTTYPKYNLSGSTRDVIYNTVTFEGGIKVVRIKMLSHHKVDFLIRGIAHLIMPFIFIFKLIFLNIRKIDVVIVYSPPLTLSLVGFFLKFWCKARFLLNVQDIFPQNAVDLGVLKNRFIIKFFELIEKYSYRFSDLIFVHSTNNMLFLKNKKALCENKIMILHNWIDIKPYATVSNDDFYRRKYGLEDKLIFLFAGVIGPSQGLELLIEVAGLIRKREDVCFLLVGDGMEKDGLLTETKRRSLTNIIFKDFVSKEEYPRLLAGADVGLVSLSSKNRTPVVPGKILGYMAASKPVLAFLNRESDAHEIIRDAQCGYSAFSDDLNMSVEACKKMIMEKNNHKNIGRNGSEYVKKNFEREKCLDLLIEKF